MWGAYLSPESSLELKQTLKDRSVFTLIVSKIISSSSKKRGSNNTKYEPTKFYTTQNHDIHKWIISVLGVSVTNCDLIPIPYHTDNTWLQSGTKSPQRFADI